MKAIEELTIWTDGGARNNPGPAGIGALITIPSKDGKPTVLAEISQYIGQTTNNQAEYQALLTALHWVEGYLTGQKRSLKTAKLTLFTDSELLAYQVRGRYRIKNGGLRPYYDDVMELLKQFAAYTITPIRREKNQVADRLVNAAIDAAITQSSH